MWTGECVRLAIFSEHSCAFSRSWSRISDSRAALESEKSERGNFSTRLSIFVAGNGGRYRRARARRRETRSPGDVILGALFVLGIVRYQDARHISRSQEPYKDLAYPYRQRRLSSALQPHRDPADSVLPYRHHPPVRRQSHRLHTQQGSAGGCPEHLLLDTQHVHDNRGVPEERGLGGAISRRRQFQIVSREREKGVQILPVGLFHAVPPGNVSFSLFSVSAANLA